jgi:hypothetical protein
MYSLLNHFLQPFINCSPILTISTSHDPFNKKMPVPQTEVSEGFEVLLVASMKMAVFWP